MLRFDVITLFPDLVLAYANVSILRRAREKKLIAVYTHELRKFASDRRGTVDQTPYGGGAGMVLMAEPVLKAVRSIAKKQKKPRVVLLSAKGRPFTQSIARRWARENRAIILIAGRYEGIDERVRTILKAEEISLGPYVLTDGDVAAMAIISAVSRLVPGVITGASLLEESHGEGGLEYPQYTRPEVLRYGKKRYRVPRILLSGNHGAVAKWREGRSR